VLKNKNTVKSLIASVPESAAGTLVALADRIDSLLGLFAVGLSPTSAADPYGLRRAALGLVQILVENRVSLSLTEAIRLVQDLLPVEVSSGVVDDTVTFVIGRLRVWLRERGHHYDSVETVLMARGDNPHQARETVVALEQWSAREDWPFILNTYGRCVRIVRDRQEMLPIDPDAFTEASSRRLYASYAECRAQISPESSVDEMFTAFLPMLEPINTFFDEVLVMAEDEAVRDNRLALVGLVDDLFLRLLDVKEIVIEGE